ncbi:ATP-binding protein [Corynebacterium bovis]|uniref:ATP-binding protein n=1 Tax=Corynebacterium bovis TaxID=36808 RepID=UPI0031386E2E
MHPRDNPYTPNAGAMPLALTGRDNLISDFEVLLHRLGQGLSGQSMIITGLRGVGKTVLLNRFRDIAEANEWQVIEIEATNNSSDSEFRSVFAREMVDVLTCLEPRRKRWSDRFLHAFLAVRSLSVSIDPSGSVSTSLGFSDDDTSPEGPLALDLTKAFQRLGQAAHEKGTGVVVLVDEIQFLTSGQLEGLIRALHKTVQRSLPMTLVGAGLPQIAELAGDAKSYAERLFIFPSIGNLSDQQAREALCHPAEKHNVVYEDAAVEVAMQHTGGYPYFIQEFGYTAWNQSVGPTITPGDVANAAADYQNKLDSSFFRVRYDRTTDLERSYLRAMADGGPGPQKTSDIASRMDRSVTELASTRRRLIDNGMIYSPAYGTAAFTVPHFDRYMRRIMPDIAEPERRGRHRLND